MNRFRLFSLFALALLYSACTVSAATNAVATNAAATNAVATNAVAAGAEMGGELPNTGAALVRVAGALILVMAILFGGIWLMKNWQRLNLVNRGVAPKLRLLETRSLGGRQAICVVAYRQQRFLVGSSTAGIQLLSQLPDEEPVENSTETPAAQSSFAGALQHLLAKPAS